MGLLSMFTGGGAATAVSAVGTVLDGLVTSDEEREQIEVLKQRIAQRPHLAQVELNKLEAQHRSVFVAGWRPWIGWVCGCGLGWQFIVRDLLAWGLVVSGIDAPPPPGLDTGPLLAMVTALLGLGGLRTAEKMGGRTR